MGGSGVFGARLIEGLLRTTGFDIIAAGRDGARLQALFERLGSARRLTTLVLDAATVTNEMIAATGAFAVVDAAGPYQGGDYRLARATIAAAAHFIDLADARDHVSGFPALDAAARAAGVAAITGASSTPALSNAALDVLTANWRQVDDVEIAISPGNRAPRGLSVMRSILSYAGRRVPLFEGGQWRERPGWGMTTRRDFPGIGRRWLSLAETPDLDIVPARFGVTRSAVFRAGLELSLLHLGLLAATWPVRLGLLRSLEPMARPFRALADLFERFGSDRGGMLVAASGLDAGGHRIEGRWSLVAEAGDGPFIPTLPALAALRRLADGRFAQPGAYACLGILPLADIEAEFEGLRVSSSMRIGPATPDLYERVLGDDFLRLPEPLRRLHRPGTGSRVGGIARVDGADGLIAGVAARAFGFPRAAEHVEVSVEITPDRECERWAREFGGQRFQSTLSAAATPGRLIERFGPFAFELDLLVGIEGVLGMPVLSWRIGPIPLPMVFAPVSIATERVDDQGRFTFHVELRLPFGLGRLVRYRGWLAAPPDQVSECASSVASEIAPDR